MVIVGIGGLVEGVEQRADLALTGRRQHDVEVQLLTVGDRPKRNRAIWGRTRSQGSGPHVGRRGRTSERWCDKHSKEEAGRNRNTPERPDLRPQ